MEKQASITRLWRAYVMRNDTRTRSQIQSSLLCCDECRDISTLYYMHAWSSLINYNAMPSIH
jgi:hypothetical protein